MINFIRRIRQQLLSENKYRKYLTYALGEIVLVVIGILIALSINNWNEANKTRKEELKMLQNFKGSLQKDITHVQWNLEKFEDANKSINLLLDHMHQDLPYNDSLSWNFSNSTAIWAPILDQEVFASLTSTDLNIITNDSLKMEVISYYSFAKRNFDVRVGLYTNTIEDASKNIFNTRFNTLWNNMWNDPDNHLEEKWMIPHDYEALKKDKEYHYFLSSQKNQLHFYVIDALNEAIYRAEKLVASIDKEIKKR